VKTPRAAIVTYASDDRRLSATMRLRACLPEGTPIYVYEGNSRIGDKLLEVGATEIINEKVETSLRFASLLGACRTNDEASQLRKLGMDRTSITIKNPDDSQNIIIPGIPEESMLDLCDELGCEMVDINDLYISFQAVAEDKDAVPIAGLRDYLMRQSSEGPLNGSQLETCMDLQDEDGGGEITFVEYLRANWNADCRLTL
ncbi:MAG: hypothetical protein ACI90V_006228, partial [Bacillariaceae sp.]|jgi:hypothetical protein